MPVFQSPLTTQLVGSYTKPSWLIRHQRVTTPYGDSGFWRPEHDVLAEALDDATLLAITDQERAGLDVVTDGEVRRERFDTYFFRLGGIDTDKLGRWNMTPRDLSFIDLDPEVERRLADARAPRVTAPITWREPITLEDLRFLKRHTSRPIKMTVIGPLTAASRLANEYYEDEEALGLALADAINLELRALDQEGVDVVQLDEPDFHFRHDQALRWGTSALDRAFDGIPATKIVHVCYGYATIGRKHLDANYGRVLDAIAASGTDAVSLEYEQPGHGPELLSHCGDKHVLLGVLDLGTRAVETVEHVAARVRSALDVIRPERLHLAPDCGMWFLPRNVAFAKIRAMADAAATVRAQL
jgi:5-methyltetrahydropteroyltriglutamate--homocysteine methyltransferase